MGGVYRAHDERLGRDLAIKVLPAEFSTDADRLRRFEQEARATSVIKVLPTGGDVLRSAKVTQKGMIDR